MAPRPEPRLRPRRALERGASGRLPGRRRRALPCPPPPAPRVESTSLNPCRLRRPGCLDQSPFAELEVDLAAQAVPESEVDEGQHRDKKRQRKPDKGERQQ